MSDLLSTSEIDNALKKVPAWELEGKAISRTFEFDDFMESIDFVNDVAEIADEAQHHPDIDIRWGKVTLTLMTHSQGGLTGSDIELAARVDNLVD